MCSTQPLCEKKEGPQMSNSTFQLEKLEKYMQINHKVNRNNENQNSNKMGNKKNNRKKYKLKLAI